MADGTRGETYAALDEGSGWKVFAGVMIILVGAFNFIDGLVALTKTSYFRSIGGSGQFPVTDSVHTWGWVVLVWGVVLVLAGFLIFSGNMFGRVVGVVVAGGNAIVQLAWLAHYPFWSFIMIFVDILVIWALVAHGGRGAPDS